MGVVSIHFNKNEERVIDELAKYYHKDRSKLLKKSLFELYEDCIDKREIKRFETREKTGKVKYFSASEILEASNSHTPK